MWFYEWIFKLMCYFDYHKWGEWIPEEHNCYQVRACSRCPKTERVAIQHEWPEWTVGDNPCVEIRVCNRCQFPDRRRLPHEFTEWALTDAKCERTRTCTKCLHTETDPVPHQPDQWTFTEEGTCGQQAQCLRCGQTLTRTEHDWPTDYTETQYELSRTCNRCGEVETTVKDDGSDDQDERGHAEHIMYGWMGH